MTFQEISNALVTTVKNGGSMIDVAKALYPSITDETVLAKKAASLSSTISAGRKQLTNKLLSEQHKPEVVAVAVERAFPKFRVKGNKASAEISDLAKFVMEGLNDSNAD